VSGRERLREIARRAMLERGADVERGFVDFART